MRDDSHDEDDDEWRTTWILHRGLPATQLVLAGHLWWEEPAGQMHDDEAGPPPPGESSLKGRLKN
jgi:hypothetical protein